MKIRLYPPLLLSLMLVCLYACVETYDIKYNLNADLLTVEGFVTDQPGSIINISISRSLELNNYAQPLKGCTVEFRVGDGSVVALKEVAEGSYAPPANFRGKAGQTYQLYFRTPDGNTYQSGKERLNPVPEIRKVSQLFNQKGLLDNTGRRVLGSTVDIYVDFDDPKEDTNYYLWRWKLYEEQSVCITCEGGQLSGNGGVCQKINSRNPPTYDYQCSSPCWDIFYNNEVNIFSDEFSNGSSLAGRLIAKVPFYSFKGSLLEIEQVGISKDAYQYYKLLRDQTQTTGTLTDTPPAPIIGNIQNVNNLNDKVIGYFGAASSKQVRYWVERTGYKDPILYPLLGREIMLEPTTPFRPPTYPCVLSRARTPIRPEGWK